MKNATKHADTLKSFVKKQLKQAGEIPALEPVDPLRALVRGCLAADTVDGRADDAMKTIDREFVDLNDLRVATELECIDIIGPRYPGIDDRVPRMIQCLNGIFAREHTLSLDRLRTLPRREARQFLRELPGMTPFVDGYTALFGLEIPAFPVDDSILATLKDDGVVEDDATAEETQKFVEHQLKDDDCYKLFYALRHKKRGK
jgi:endonuclease III